MSKPARRVDFVAAGVASTFGAGLFTGLAPAASLAGSWLLVAFVVAAGLGYLTVLSTSERPLGTMPVRVRRVVFGVGVLGRLAAAVAVAGTFGRYLVPSGPAFGAVVMVVVVTVVAVAAPRPPVVVVRLAAVAVLGCLALVVLACFAIEPVAPAVAVADGGSAMGLVASAGVLTVCFLGVGPLPRGARVVDVHLPPDEQGSAGRPGDGGRADVGDSPAADGSPLERGGSAPGDGDGAGSSLERGEPALDEGENAGTSSERGESAVCGKGDGVGSRSGCGGSLAADGAGSSATGGAGDGSASEGGGSATGGARDGAGSLPAGGGPSLDVGGWDQSPLEFGVGRVAVRVWRLGVVAVLTVVLIACLAVGAAVLRQLGAPRLALSPTPLLDALAAADASALEPLVLAGVAIATGFALLGILRGLVRSGGAVPPVRVGVAAGVVVAVGAALVEPTVALAAASVLLLGDAAFRLVAVRHRRLG